MSKLSAATSLLAVLLASGSWANTLNSEGVAGPTSIGPCAINAEPGQLVCQVRNNASEAIAAIDFQVSITEARRTVPWGGNESRVIVYGGIEPEETAEVVFPLMGMPPQSEDRDLTWTFQSAVSRNSRGNPLTAPDPNWQAAVFATCGSPPDDTSSREQGDEESVLEELKAILSETNGRRSEVGGSFWPEPRPSGEAAAEYKEEPGGSADTVADALAAALAAGSEDLGARPETETKTAGSACGLAEAEWDALAAALSPCWVIDFGSEASEVAVTRVTFELDRDRRVVGEVRPGSAQGSSPSAVEAAFQVARDAVLRCQPISYPLPPEKYDAWRWVELGFVPIRQ